MQACKCCAAKSKCTFVLLSSYQNIISYFWFKYDLGEKYYTPQVQPDRGSNSRHPDQDSTFPVIEMPARPSETSVLVCIWIYTLVSNPVFSGVI